MRSKGIGELQIVDSQMPRAYMLFQKRDHVSECIRAVDKVLRILPLSFASPRCLLFFRAEKWYRYYMVSLLYWDCETRGISMAPSISMQQPAGIDFYETSRSYYTM